MFNLISRNVVRPVVLACIVFAGTNAALAQTPQQRRDRRRRPAIRHDHQDRIRFPGTTTPTQNPAAPPGTQQTSPTTPPGTTVPEHQAQRPRRNAGVPGSPAATDEPLREPVIPQFQAKPLPPVPSLSRLGVGSETVPCH